MVLKPEEVIFGLDDRAVVVASMARLAKDRDGWLNLSPVLPDGVDQPRQGLLRFLGARGPEALLGTWVPGPRTGEGWAPTTIGLQHAAGRRIVARLAEAGHPVPEGWRVTQDHLARGLVATVPDDADPDQVLVWLVGAAEHVATLPLTGRWCAAFYRKGSAGRRGI
ncbi:MAG: hypothetical protein DLM54_06335 [Acidimicrobiales bacterium]|nr:MAG: hypothetical protein DLM54_06335 [Acidimicrobiales bacterium]